MQLTHAPEVELDPALSPDGSLIAYAGGELGRTKLLVRQISGGRVLSVADSFVGVRTPRWSPDGSRLAFEAIDGIYLVPTLGGAPRRVVESGRSSKKLSRAHSPAWSPDGTALAYAADSGIYLLSLNSGASRRVGRSFEPHALSWSPDGAWLAFVSGNAQQSIECH